MLTVPKPTLTFEPLPGGAATLEKPVNVAVGAVKDGAKILGPEGLGTFGFFAYRRLSAGAGLELWDDAAKSWKPDPGPAVASVKPTQLAYKAGEPNPWTGIVVAAGGKDSAGKPQFAKAKAGYPLYNFRAWFASKDNSLTGLSAPSDNVTFVGASDKNLVAIGAGDDEKPEEATQARLLLKDPGMQVIGQVLIERASSGAKITVQNLAGAAITLHPDGRIELAPASGQRLIVSGDIDVGRITYQPSGGGGKLTL
jgi:hypothetical protein